LIMNWKSMCRWFDSGPSHW